MTTYRVLWEIDIDTDSAAEAARLAIQTQRDLDSTATCFTVVDPSGNETHLDLVTFGCAECDYRGWLEMTTCEGEAKIERCDTCQRFASDDDALRVKELESLKSAGPEVREPERFEPNDNNEERR